MTVDLDKIIIAKSGLTDTVFAGVLNKKGDQWLKKKDVTQSFINTVIARWENQTETISSGENQWEITVKKIK